MNAIQRQTLLNLTENLFEAIDQTESIITQTRDAAKVRAEFDTLRETIDRYIPPETPANEQSVEQRQFLTWKFRKGTRIRLDNPGDQAHGSVGIVTAIHVYSGPAILDYWEYMVRWESGFLAPGTGLCPERWAEEVPKAES